MRIAAAYRMLTRKVLEAQQLASCEWSGGEELRSAHVLLQCCIRMRMALLRMLLFGMRVAAGFGDPCLCGRLPQRTGPQLLGHRVRIQSKEGFELDWFLPLSEPCGVG